VNLYACSRFQMVMQKDTKIYPDSGKRRTYVQQGRESLYYFAPKCLYRGEYKRGMECGDVSCTTTYGWCVMLYRVIVYLFLGLPFYSSKEKPRVQV